MVTQVPASQKNVHCFFMNICVHEGETMLIPSNFDVCLLLRPYIDIDSYRSHILYIYIYIHTHIYIVVYALPVSLLHCSRMNLQTRRVQSKSGRPSSQEPSKSAIKKMLQWSDLSEVRVMRLWGEQFRKTDGEQHSPLMQSEGLNV